MRGLALFGVIATLLARAAAASVYGTFEGYVTLSGDQSLTSGSAVQFRNNYVYCDADCQWLMWGTHAIQWSRTGESVAVDRWSELSLSSRTLVTGSAALGECYFATNTAKAQFVRGSINGAAIPFTPYDLGSASWRSDTACRARPCDDFNGNDICDNQEPIDKDPNQDSCPGGAPCSSPIVVNLDRGTYRLSDVSDPVFFDIDADGIRNRITWTARDSNIAFIAVDRNGNHTVDNGTELFGNWTALDAGGRAANGFEALKEFDSNGDGIVSSVDERWSTLLLWTDVNHDGVSQPAELESVAASAVEVLGTSYHWTGRRDASGNYFGYQGIARMGGVSRPFYDVYFRSVP